MAGVKIGDAEWFCAGRIIQSNKGKERVLDKYVSFDTDEAEGRVVSHYTLQQALLHCVNYPCLNGKVATDFDTVAPIDEAECTFKGMRYGYSNNYRCWVIYDLHMCSDDEPFFKTKKACKDYIDGYTGLQ